MTKDNLPFIDNFIFIDDFNFTIMTLFPLYLSVIAIHTVSSILYLPIPISQLIYLYVVFFCCSQLFGYYAAIIYFKRPYEKPKHQVKNNPSMHTYIHTYQSINQLL